MEHRQQFEALNKQALEKLEEYMKEKNFTDQEKNEKLHTAKEKWQGAWNEFLETLLVLERLEI